MPQYQTVPTQYNQTLQQQQQQPYHQSTEPHHQITAATPSAQKPFTQRNMSKDQPDHFNQQQQNFQVYRGGSPGVVSLRKEAPINQKSIPVYNSQPAAISLKGGNNMRGDLKWPPPEYKEAATRENDERRKIAMGPACRPRKVQKDYTSFFAKNALSHHYPSYKVPPGTQHIVV